MTSSAYDKFETRYKNGDTPWELGRADKNLVQTLEQFPITPCKALDIGCGTGSNARWLAQKGFEVIGADISAEAVRIAEEQSPEKNLSCRFVQVDFMEEQVPGAPFGFLFDRGCFHGSELADGRGAFARKASEILTPGGLWLTLTGNMDGPQGAQGPPRLSALDIVSAAEPWFTILQLKAGFFDTTRIEPARAWIGLMRKRDNAASF